MTFTNTTALKIEYGAGNMASADEPNKHHQVVTEYRGIRELKRVYGRKGAGSPNGIPGAILDATDRSPGTKDLIMKSRNVRVSFGVNATERCSTKGLGKAWCLRFTNPNMGDEDIQRDLEAIGPSDLTGKGLSTGNLEVTVNDASGAGCSATSTPNIKHLQKELSDLRNMYLLYGFFSNAQTNLENGGKLELVLKSKFFDAWLLEHLAENFGYRLTKTDKDYEMGHVHVRTQDARSVSHERNNPNLYTFRAGIWAVDPLSHELPEDELQPLAHPVQAKPLGFVEFVKGLEGYNPQTINKKSLAFRSEFIPGINVDASHEPDTD